MCGILGFIRIAPTERNIEIEDFLSAVSECQERGTDAVGWFSDVCGTVKSPGRPLEYATERSDALVRALSGDFLMLHTRASTIGFDGPAPPNNNANNHPFEGERYVVVHNGVIRYTPKLKGYKYAGHCDSELVLGLIETFGVEKGLEFLDTSDSFSLVIYDKQTKEVHFARHHNPMVFSLTGDKTMIYFGSTPDIALELDGGFQLGQIGLWGTGQCSQTPEDKLITWNGEAFTAKALSFRTTVGELTEHKEFDVDSYYSSLRKEKPSSYAISRGPVSRYNSGEDLFLQMVGGRIYFDEPLEPAEFHRYPNVSRVD